MAVAGDGLADVDDQAILGVDILDVRGGDVGPRVSKRSFSSGVVSQRVGKSGMKLTGSRLTLIQGEPTRSRTRRTRAALSSVLVTWHSSAIGTPYSSQAPATSLQAPDQRVLRTLAVVLRVRVPGAARVAAAGPGEDRLRAEVGGDAHGVGERPGGGSPRRLVRADERLLPAPGLHDRDAVRGEEVVRPAQRIPRERRGVAPEVCPDPGQPQFGDPGDL